MVASKGRASYSNAGGIGSRSNKYAISKEDHIQNSSKMVKVCNQGVTSDSKDVGHTFVKIQVIQIIQAYLTNGMDLNEEAREVNEMGQWLHISFGPNEVKN